MLFKRRTFEKFRRTPLQHCWRCSYLSVHSLSSSIFEQQSVLPPGKRRSMSAATGTLRSAVPCAWCNFVLADVLRTDQVIMWWCEVKTVVCLWQHCRPKFMTAPAVLTLVCSLALSRRRNIRRLNAQIYRSEFAVVPIDKTFQSSTTLQFVTKYCYCSCFLFFSLSHPISNGPHIDSKFTIRPGQTFVQAYRLLTFSNLAFFVISTAHQSLPF